jgi:hypothetical protein
MRVSSTGLNAFLQYITQIQFVGAKIGQAGSIFGNPRVHLVEKCDNIAMASIARIRSHEKNQKELWFTEIWL